MIGVIGGCAEKLLAAGEVGGGERRGGTDGE
jgi:hypothetical protein